MDKDLTVRVGHENPSNFRITKNGTITTPGGKEYQIAWRSRQSPGIYATLPHDPVISNLFVSLLRNSSKVINIDDFTISKEGVNYGEEKRDLFPKAQEVLEEVQKLASVRLLHEPGSTPLASDPVFYLEERRSASPLNTTEVTANITVKSSPKAVKKEFLQMYVLSPEALTVLDGLLKDGGFCKEMSLYLSIYKNLRNQMTTDVSQARPFLHELETHSKNLLERMPDVPEVDIIKEYIYFMDNTSIRIHDILLVTQQLMGSIKIEQPEMQTIVSFLTSDPENIKDFEQFLRDINEVQQKTIDIILKNGSYTAKVMANRNNLDGFNMIILPKIADFSNASTVRSVINTLIERALISNGQPYTDSLKMAYNIDLNSEGPHRRTNQGKLGSLASLEQKDTPPDVSSIIRLGFYGGKLFYKTFAKAEWIAQDPNVEGTQFTRAVRVVGYGVSGKEARYFVHPIDLSSVKLTNPTQFKIAIDLMFAYLNKLPEVAEGTNWNDWLASHLNDEKLPPNVLSSEQVTELTRLSKTYLQEYFQLLSKTTLSYGHEGIQFPGVYSFKPATGKLDEDRKQIEIDLKQIFHFSDAEIKKISVALNYSDKAQFFKELIDTCQMALVINQHITNPEAVHIKNVETAHKNFIDKLHIRRFYEAYRDTSHSQANVTLESAANFLLERTKGHTVTMALIYKYLKNIDSKTLGMIVNAMEDDKFAKQLQDVLKLLDSPAADNRQVVREAVGQLVITLFGSERLKIEDKDFLSKVFNNNFNL